eukprot:g3219.t1
MNILSECIVGGTRTCRNLGTSAAKIAHSSAKENLDLRGGKIRIDEAMNDRIMGLARRCQEIENEKKILSKQIRELSVSRDTVMAELKQAKQMVREISHRCSEERKLQRDSTKVVDRLEKELNLADEKSRRVLERLRESMKIQKLARERQIQVEERMKNEEKRHAQALRRVLREKREKEREIAVMKQLMKTRDREREEEFSHYRARLEHAKSTNRNSSVVTKFAVTAARTEMNEIDELRRLLKQKDRQRVEAVMKLEKIIANWETKFEERVRDVTKDAERRSKESKELMEKHREDARNVSKQNQDLKRRFELKDKELKESKGMLDSWRFQKEDLHRLLRGAELKCKQLEFELQRVQQTALFEMQQRKIAVREKCAEHVENCDLRMKIKELQMKLECGSSSSSS